MVGRGGRGDRPGRFSGGREARGGKAVVPGGGNPVMPASDTALRSGSVKLRLGRLGRFGRGGRLPGRGMRPGSVVAGWKVAEAGFSGERGLREGLVEVGSRGTVGRPV